MLSGDATHYARLPFYQQVLVGLLVPPIIAAVLCLRIKGLGEALGTSNKKIVRNATDWVAFVSFVAAGYAVMISVFAYAHFAHH